MIQPNNNLKYIYIYIYIYFSGLSLSLKQFKTGLGLNQTPIKATEILLIVCYKMIIPQNRHYRMILQSRHTTTFQILPHYVHL
jgi:hypothetical protein